MFSQNLRFSSGGTRDELLNRGSKNHSTSCLILQRFVEKWERVLKLSLFKNHLSTFVLFGIPDLKFLLVASSIFYIPLFSRAHAFYLSARVPHLRRNCHHVSFPGITLAPITTDKTDIPVRILFTIIYFGACGDDWLIKFCALVTFCVLIDYLRNVFFPEIGATNLSFAYFFLSVDDSESLGASSSSLSISPLYLVLLNHST